MTTQSLEKYEASKDHFEIWWKNEGSKPPMPNDDLEEHTKKQCLIAWCNGFYTAVVEKEKSCLSIKN